MAVSRSADRPCHITCVREMVFARQKLGEVSSFPGGEESCRGNDVLHMRNSPNCLINSRLPGDREAKRHGSIF